ncbi:DUF5666 domain-containing protein [Aquabacterium sp.]|uniref:DUF5666 domain-containing protein n=1 Tax=Aquabacterium sp. TaxID=1872578 RepID=UPI0026153CB6|nr:DUF5666 domain-containing protein [Aquabacterium sp.]MDD2976513.1 DUF5666 domain-containing protein [Aquabacterium sp.]
MSCFQSWSKSGAWGLAAVSLAALAACGGGGGGDANAATPSNFAQGSIEGFGSIIVNGVRYDETQARVSSDEGATLASEALKLGMVVEVLASAPTASPTGLPTAKASAVRTRSEVEGPLTAIAGDMLTVLGQSVRLTPATFFDDDLVNGRTSLAVGQRLEVYGHVGQDGVLTATRIDLEDDTDDYKLRGTVTALDPVNRTFNIGGATLSYASLATQPALAEGQVVDVRVATGQQGGAWVLTRLRAPTSLVAGQSLKAELEGVVSEVIYQGAQIMGLVVNGVRVDTGSVTLPVGLAQGNLVEVEGRLHDGVLTASKVEREQRLDGDEGFEVQGRITALDTVQKTFELRGVKVKYNDSTRFEDGGLAQLALNAKVEVSATLEADGRTLLATEVEFDD